MKRILSSVAFTAAFALYALFQHSDTPLSSVSAKGVPPTTPALNSPSTPSSYTLSAASSAASSRTMPRQQPMMARHPQHRGPYRDGTYTGQRVYVYYGYVQVQATVTNGFLADVRFLSHPSGRAYSIQVNDYAIPLLRQEALSAQSAPVDTISGATETSGGFRESLASALTQAHA